MKKILTTISAALLFAAGCSSSKMTKLERTIDEVVSRYELTEDKEIGVGGGKSAIAKTNSQLNAELADKICALLSNCDNISDLKFLREAGYDFYIVDTLQFVKYKISCYCDVDFINSQDTLKPEVFISSATIKRCCSKDVGGLLCVKYQDKIYVNFDFALENAKIK